MHVAMLGNFVGVYVEEKMAIGMVIEMSNKKTPFFR